MKNFTDTLSKIGFLGINKMMDNAEGNYSHFNIFQASDLQGKLEEIGISIDKVNIALIHSVNKLLSIKLTTVKKMVR